MQNFLGAFGLIEKPIFFLGSYIQINPIWMLVIVAFLQLIFNFLNAVMPNISFEAFNRRIRNFIIIDSFGDKENENCLLISDISNILSNLSPRVAVFISSAVQFISTVIMVIMLLAGMANISFKLTIVSLVAMAILSFPVIISRNRPLFYASIIHDYSSRFIKKLLRDVKNIYFLRIVGTNEDEATELLDVSRNIFKNYVKHVTVVMMNNTLPLFAGVMVLMTIVFVNSKNNLIASSSIIPFVYFLVRISQSISRAGATIGQMQFTYPFFTEFLGMSFYSVSSIEKARIKSKGSQKIVPLNLKVAGLAIGRKSPLMKDVTFEVQEGSFAVIAGKSGKGKTTLLMTLIGILDKLKGKILWNGIPIENLDVVALKRHVGYSGTYPFLLDDTIKVNLAYGVGKRDVDEEEMRRVLHIAQCSFVYDLNGGIDYKLKDDGEGISSGQKQRLSIARALVHKPSVLILDEATSNIDEPTEQKILSAIRSAYPKMLVIAVSHRDSVKNFATQIIDI
ncbi:ABC transporter ATP-binding protein [Candidatus Peregrinibacteria bacterium]|nr:ABC transporter ATP-binding protein [Candidatus Peregrinibacteria bacterium]